MWISEWGRVSLPTGRRDQTRDPTSSEPFNTDRTITIAPKEPVLYLSRGCLPRFSTGTGMPSAWAICLGIRAHRRSQARTHQQAAPSGRPTRLCRPHQPLSVRGRAADEGRCPPSQCGRPSPSPQSVASTAQDREPVVDLPPGDVSCHVRAVGGSAGHVQAPDAHCPAVVVVVGRNERCSGVPGHRDR